MVSPVLDCFNSELFADCFIGQSCACLAPPKSVPRDFFVPKKYTDTDVLYCSLRIGFSTSSSTFPLKKEEMVPSTPMTFFCITF